MDSTRVYFALLIALGGFIFISLFSGSAQYPTQATINVIWPVKPGRNQITCPALQKTPFVRYDFRSLAWRECQKNCESEDPVFEWKAGVENAVGQTQIKIKDGSASKYNLDRRGILFETKNVTAADNGILFRCDMMNYKDGFLDVESAYIRLLFEPEDETPAVDGTSQTPGIETTNTTGGPTRGASSECSSSFYLGIGVAVGIGSCIVLALGYAFYRWKSKRRGAAHFTTKQEEGEEGGGLMLNLAPETGLANENKTVKA